MGKRLNILCVDDDEDIRAILEMSLGLDGVTDARTVSSEREALELLSGTAWQPDCILLDVRISDTDGRALLDKIRRLTKHAATPVIFLTASVRHADLESYRALGAAGVIAKPFDPLALASHIRSLL
jgi:two-component system OmpR family response regulator